MRAMQEAVRVVSGERSDPVTSHRAPALLSGEISVKPSDTTTATVAGADQAGSSGRCSLSNPWTVGP